MKLYAKGPRDAHVLLVGEAPGETEVAKGLPFVGASGMEMEKMLRESGIDPASLRITNVCHVRPEKNKIANFFPTSKKEAALKNASYEYKKYFTKEISIGMEALKMEIEAMPNLEMILAVGNTPLWALTGEWGIDSWRGSQMFARRLSRPIPLVPTYHPAGVMRMWEWRWISVLDYKRAMRWWREGFKVPKHEITIRPSFGFVRELLLGYISRVEAGEVLPIAVDVETRSGHIACIGLAADIHRAVCIPLMTTRGAYWSPAEECDIVWLLFRLLTNERCEVIGQNFLYDQQYFARRWGFLVRLVHDTMVKQHLCFPGVSKGLDFLSSVYNHYHLYWKDESKDWDPRVGEEQLWTYNGKDCLATFEANGHLDKFVETFRVQEQLKKQMLSGERAIRMMLRGIRIDPKKKDAIGKECLDQMEEMLKFLQDSTVPWFKPTSPKQVMQLCYDVLKLPPVYKDTGDGKRLTADKDAIKEWIGKCEPLFRPLLQAIADYRSLQVYRSTFALSPVDADGRFRCSINVAGTSTFRWSTSEDAFGFGTNMQNIPKGNEDD